MSNNNSEDAARQKIWSELVNSWQIHTTTGNTNDNIYQQQKAWVDTPIGDPYSPYIQPEPYVLPDHNHTLGGFFDGHKPESELDQIDRIFKRLKAQVCAKSDLVKKLLEAGKALLIYDPDKKEIQIRDKSGRIYASKPLREEDTIKHHKGKQESRPWPGPMIGSDTKTYTTTGEPDAQKT